MHRFAQLFVCLFVVVVVVCIITGICTVWRYTMSHITELYCGSVYHHGGRHRCHLSGELTTTLTTWCWGYAASHEKWQELHTFDFLYVPITYLTVIVFKQRLNHYDTMSQMKQQSNTYGLTEWRCTENHSFSVTFSSLVNHELKIRPFGSYIHCESILQ